MDKFDFKHILVPTDFGDHAACALEAGLALAKKFDAQLTLLHAYYLPPPAYDVGVAWPIEDFASSAQKALDDAVAQAKRHWPKCGGAFEIGYPSDVIVKTARKRGSDLIVMGTHGRRGLPRMLLGSVAEKVVRTSPVPVLTVSADEATSAGPLEAKA